MNNIQNLQPLIVPQPLIVSSFQKHNEEVTRGIAHEEVNRGLVHEEVISQTSKFSKLSKYKNNEGVNSDVEENNEAAKFNHQEFVDNHQVYHHDPLIPTNEANEAITKLILAPSEKQADATIVIPCLSNQSDASHQQVLNMTVDTKIDFPEETVDDFNKIPKVTASMTAQKQPSKGKISPTYSTRTPRSKCSITPTRQSARIQQNQKNKQMIDVDVTLQSLQTSPQQSLSTMQCTMQSSVIQPQKKQTKKGKQKEECGQQQQSQQWEIPPFRQCGLYDHEEIEYEVAQKFEKSASAPKKSNKQASKGQQKRNKSAKPENKAENADDYSQILFRNENAVAEDVEQLEVQGKRKAKGRQQKKVTIEEQKKVITLSESTAKSKRVDQQSSSNSEQQSSRSKSTNRSMSEYTSEKSDMSFQKHMRWMRTKRKFIKNRKTLDTRSAAKKQQMKQTKRTKNHDDDEQGPTKRRRYTIENPPQVGQKFMKDVTLQNVIAANKRMSSAIEDPINQNQIIQNHQTCSQLPINSQLHKQQSQQHTQQQTQIVINYINLPQDIDKYQTQIFSELMNKIGEMSTIEHDKTTLFPKICQKVVEVFAANDQRKADQS